MGSQQIFLFAGRCDFRDAFLVVEYFLAERRRVTTGRAQQLRYVHHVLFVRDHYLRTTTIRRVYIRYRGKAIFVVLRVVRTYLVLWTSNVIPSIGQPQSGWRYLELLLHDLYNSLQNGLMTCMI